MSGEGLPNNFKTCPPISPFIITFQVARSHFPSSVVFDPLNSLISYANLVTSEPLHPSARPL
jgi:hypothetical protein